MLNKWKATALGVSVLLAASIGIVIVARPSASTFTVIETGAVRERSGPEAVVSCDVTVDGGTCKLEGGLVVPRIATAYGMTREAVASGLGVSSDAVDISGVLCESAPLRAGQTWYLKSVGTSLTYRITQTTWTLGDEPRSRTSGRLTAFVPDAASIACGLAGG